MVDEAWKEFFDDEMTWKAFNDSEVFQAYARAELSREAVRTGKAIEAELDMKSQAMQQLDEFQEKLDADPKLRERFKKAKAALDSDPELAKKVDPNFINGIRLLNLED